MIDGPSLTAELSYYIFLAVAAYFGLRVFRDTRSFISYPVLTAAIWIIYVVPQAYGILYNPVHLPAELFRYGFATTMAMSVVCILIGNGGWYIGKRSGRRARCPTDLRELNSGRLQLVGIGLVVLGLLAFSAVTRQSGGVFSYYSISGAYQLDWRGTEVIASFFSQVLLNIGSIVLIFSFYMRPRLLTAVLAALALAPSLADAIFLSKRSDIVYIAIAVTAPAFFIYNWSPSRRSLTLAAILGMFVVFAFPVIRGTLLIGAWGDVNFLEAFKRALFDKVLSGSDHKEFNNSIGIVGSSNFLLEFGYGRIIWNDWVMTTVPRSLLGQEAKDMLSFTNTSLEDFGLRAFGWLPVWFQSRTGASLLYADFWYFGSLVFGIVGYSFGRIYRRAVHGDRASQLLFVILLLLLPHWIAVGFYKAPRDLIMTFVIVKFVVWSTRASSRGAPPPARTGSEAQQLEARG